MYISSAIMCDSVYVPCLCVFLRGLSKRVYIRSTESVSFPKCVISCPLRHKILLQGRRDGEAIDNCSCSSYNKGRGMEFGSALMCGASRLPGIPVPVVSMSPSGL